MFVTSKIRNAGKDAALEVLGLTKLGQNEEEDLSPLVGTGLIGAGLGVGAAPKTQELLTGRTKLYHGTSAPRAKAIQEKGLRPASDLKKIRGVTEMLEKDVRTPAKRLVYMDPNKATAKQYSIQQELIEKKLGPKFSPKQLREALPRIQQRALLTAKMNPFRKANVIEAKLPLWREDIASKLTQNPEMMGSLDEFTDSVIKRMARSQGITPVQAKEQLELTANLQGKTSKDLITHLHTELGKSKVFKDGIPAEYIKGPQYQRMGLQELGQYIKANPRRFAGGAGLALLGTGLAGAGLKTLLD